MNRVRLVRALFAGVAAVVCTLASSAGFAAKVGPVEDPVRVVKIGKGQPIVIGGYFVLSGPDIALGLDQQRGVQLAIDDLGGKLIGRPVKFIAEDDQCGAEGGQTAGSKLAANEQIVLVIGPSCSSSARVAVPLLWKAGIPSIGVSASSPVLTAPDRGAAYDGFLRVILNDGWLAPKIAEYARKVMKLEEISTIHDGSVYAQNLVKNVEDSFRKMGGKVCGSEAVETMLQGPRRDRPSLGSWQRSRQEGRRHGLVHDKWLAVQGRQRCRCSLPARLRGSMLGIRPHQR